MNDENNLESVQVLAAERYLEARRTYAPATITYVYRDTYNYILNKIWGIV